ncbi:MAG: glycosyltransferase family 2 protein, partial [bacterium]|nr:glycosyltransferase family 2 protein [bacterium]
LLEKQAVQGIELSIVVVVDGSTDGTRETIRSFFPDVIVIEGDGNWWWTKSVNEGCKLAVKNGANAVLLLNDDVQFRQNYLEALLGAVEKEPGAIIGSLNITAENQNRIYFSGAKGLQWWSGKLLRYHRFLSIYNYNMTGLHKSIVLPGRGVFIPVRVFNEIGFYDEKALPQYKADYDFVLRAHKKKIKTLVSWDAIILVQVESTGKGATFTKQSP